MTEHDGHEHHEGMTKHEEHQMGTQHSAGHGHHDMEMMAHHRMDESHADRQTAHAAAEHEDITEMTHTAMDHEAARTMSMAGDTTHEVVMAMSGHDHREMGHEAMAEMDHESMDHETVHPMRMTDEAPHDMGMNMQGHDHGDMMMDHGAHMGHEMAGMDHDMAGMGDDMMMHGGHMMHMGNMRLKLLVSLILTVPIVVLSPMMGMALPFTVTGLPGQDWLVLILGSILFFYGGTPFFSGARGELASRQPAMMTLITMGISVAYFYSVYATIMHMIQPTSMVMDFFWELATLIDIMLLGHIIEMNAVMKAGSAMDALADLLPKQAHKYDAAGNVLDVPVASLVAHDRVLVKENERVPADGIVQTTAIVDESLLTGEATLVTKAAGDAVVGGALNGSRAFDMLVTQNAQAGFLNQVQQLVAQAQARKSASETLADKVAGWLFYAAMIVGILALVVWTTVHGFSYALPIAVTVFIIACPHALGLAVPLVAARLTGLAASEGILIQNRAALEQVNRVKTVLMDKTGTLTAGKFAVQEVVAFDNQKETDVLALAAALETGSSHPIAAGILAEVADKGVTVPTVSDVVAIAGAGVSGMVAGHQMSLTNLATALENGLPVDEATYNRLASQGFTVSVLADEDQVLGMVALGDAVKPDAVTLIHYLKRQGIRPVMVTGDNVAAAQKVADQLGVQEVVAEVKPADKLALVAQYQADGAVMMIGDGVNDSPALAAADIGVAIGAGTDVAINAADVVLVRSQPADVIGLLQLARDAKRKMTENLWWGAGYNLVAIPLAAGILIPLGFKLDPMVGAVLMSLSTVIVAVNAMSMRLRRETSRDGE